jgi:hypothetical protein
MKTSPRYVNDCHHLAAVPMPSMCFAAFIQDLLNSFTRKKLFHFKIIVNLSG